jgi:hypothetical protein
VVGDDRGRPDAMLNSGRAAVALLTATFALAPSAAPALGQSPGATATPAATPAASIAPVVPIPAPSFVASARTELEAWMAGKIDLSHYSPDARAQFSDSAVSQIAKYLKPLGAIKTFGYDSQIIVTGIPVAVFLAVCEKGSIDELISWNAAGKVQLILFRPPQP